MTVHVGGETFELFHGRGETDDATWVYVPEPQGAGVRRLLHLGVAQRRQPAEGAALRQGLGRRVARHGGEGRRAVAARPRRADRRRRPRHASVERVGGTARLPARRDAADDEQGRVARRHRPRSARAGRICLERPYLRPVYDEPEFVVRNIWRLYGGWWDGDPSPPEAGTSRHVRGRSRRARRAASTRSPSARLALAEAGDDESLRLAGQLAQIAVDAEPDNKAAHAARAEVFDRRVAAEASTMSKGVFSWTAAESPAKSSRSDDAVSRSRAG